MKRLWWMGPLRDEEGQSGGGGGATTDGMPPDGDIAALSAQLKKQAQELEKMKGALAERPIVTPPPPPTPAPSPAAPDPKEIEKQFWKDPLNVTAAISQQVAREMVGNLAQQNYDTNLQAAKMVALQDPERKKIYDKYSVDVEAKLAAVQPQFRTNPTVWINAITMVKGEKMEEIIKERTTGPAIRVSDGPSAPGHRPAPASPSTKLTPEQQRMARNLKMTDEQYARGIQRYENQDKSWSEVVTFDSLEKRNAARSAKK